MNKELFATALLRGLDLPISQARINIFYAWFNAENTKAENNPLATTWKKTGSTYFNCLKKTQSGTCTMGVQNYPTEKMGIEATLQTLKQDFYKNIIEAIKNDTTKFDYNNEELIKEFSKWGTGYKNFLGQFAKYGTTTGKKIPASEESKINPLYIFLGLGLAFGIYKYSTKK